VFSGHAVVQVVQAMQLEFSRSHGGSGSNSASKRNEFRGYFREGE
jgi:hypothetical protein